MIAMRSLWCAAAVMAVLLAPSLARADVFDGDLDDPREPATRAARDIERVTSRFDGTPGAWTVTVRFFGRLTSSDAATLRAFLRARDATGACEASTLAQFVASTDPASGSAVGGSYSGSDPPADEPSAAKAFSADRRELTLWLSDARLRGRSVCSIEGVKVSRGTVFDTIPPIPFSGPGCSEQTAEAVCPDTVRPLATLAFPTSGMRLVDGRLVGAIVRDSSEQATAAVGIWLGETRLGLARYRITAGDTVPIAVRLSGRGRRRLAGRGPNASLVVRLQLTDGVGNQSVVERRARLRRADR